ncbi:TonB-dependent receptor [Lysobacter sp. MMG2]|uniref:TonB-dependent receptor family protein n=1 Tax=Lysobacter sp. MMG2 TaxID=2801338 RepID=UPI001C228950|nr:TonB-dependent receptor [Lysobacter sp. MMG2]MBU8977493.1 TonB-dependent receptor [Lysobacter sp. MMG2]
MTPPLQDDSGRHVNEGAVCKPSRRAHRRPAAAPLALALSVALVVPAHAQSRDSATTLDTVQVLGARHALSDFPGSISVIDGDTLRSGQRQVSLSEALVRAPGITVLDRQNYAQDLQVQSRGFGARSTFGIRGIKLIVDGIPSSALDGQGQAASFPLSALDRIQVLRGPLALQYGNAAGGAIVGETAFDGPSAEAEGWVGSDSSARGAAGFEGATGDNAWQWRALGSYFTTDGDRPHSAAQRTQVDAVAQYTPDDDSRLRLVAGGLSQPYTDDPLGLTRAQWERDPHGTDPVAEQFDTRKKIDNAQIGARWEDAYAPGREYWIGGYGVKRDVVQFLAVPIAAQRAPGSAGGVIDLGRTSAGIDAGHRWSFDRGALTVGIESGWLDEARRGYENFVGTQLGVRGALRRDEDNRIRSLDAFVLGELRPADAWTLLGAVRRSELRFESDDHYIAPGNGDDSGSLDYGETAAALGVSRAFGSGEVFASVGRGFETPTVTELAYRPDGSAGFNTDLQPAHFDTAEIGTRWRADSVEASVSAYRIDGEDEIVPATNSGGRASFANAGRTRREGVEAGIEGRLHRQWSYALTANWLRARFTEDFSYRVASGAVQIVEAGNRIPGIPRANGYAELAWNTRDGRTVAAMEMRASDGMPTDDRNTDASNGYATFALRLQWRAAASGWYGFARVDNLFDRDYAGSVIVNEGNARYFEPAPGRGFTLGLGWKAGG